MIRKHIKVDLPVGIHIATSLELLCGKTCRVVTATRNGRTGSTLMVRK